MNQTYMWSKKKKKKASSRYDIIECNLGQIWKNAK